MLSHPCDITTIRGNHDHSLGARGQVHGIGQWWLMFAVLLTIAAVSWDVTASLGWASTVTRGPAPKPLELIEWLIARADAAMYDASAAVGIRFAMPGI